MKLSMLLFVFVFMFAIHLQTSLEINPTSILLMADVPLEVKCGHLCYCFRGRDLRDGGCSQVFFFFVYPP